MKRRIAMADESKPQDPKPATRSTNVQNPITELPTEGGVLTSLTGGAVASTSGIVADAAFGPTGGTTLATDPGADVAGKLGEDAPVFGKVLESIGLAIAESQKALDDGVI